ncbi:MAG: DNA alkylation repair protein [Myxococcales bacterium]|nr:DNA alkylation repair protein [Myxococcales bacterium]
MGEPFKEKLNAQAVAAMADAIREAWPAFDAAGFQRDATTGLQDLELMDRVRHLAATLAAWLPSDFPHAVGILLRAMGPPADPAAPEASTRDAGGLSGFAMMAVTRFVAEQGGAHVDVAFDAFHAMTGRFSAEFDVRPFLAADPQRAWARLSAFARDPDPHVRRLASEGTRPFLPWGMRVPALVADPEPGLALLAGLKDDPSEYVRRSVANHLNDVARTHPARVCEVAAQWLVGATAERQKVVRHALRGLLRAADPGALRLLGFDPDVAVRVLDLAVPAAARLGARMPFTFTVVHEGESGSPVILDYVLERPLARGKRGEKVFRIAQRNLAPGQRVDYATHHDFKAVTTRTDRPGDYGLTLRVNGRRAARASFTVAG